METCWQLAGVDSGCPGGAWSQFTAAYAGQSDTQAGSAAEEVA